MRHKLILAGGGSGTAEYLLPAAKKALEEVELVIASPRFLELLHARKTMPMGHISELLESLPAMLERESIGIVVSGDPLLYSLCRTLRNRYPELEMQVIPGVGSLQLLGAAFGLTMEQAVKHCTQGVGIWDWASSDAGEEPDIVMACCGDTPTLVHELTYERANRNLSVHGYQEEGTITTPFDMRVQNEIDRFHLVKDALLHLPQLGNKGAYLIQQMNDKLVAHKNYIHEIGQDMPEILDWKWHLPESK